MSRRGRRSIELPGVKHRSPIPMAARVGRLICSSGIPGIDAQTGEMPADAGEQAANVFRHMKALLAEGGASLDDVVRVTIFIQDEQYRALINPLWLAHFPEDGNRPARHILIYEHLRGGMRVQLEFIAECQSDE